MQGLLVKAKRKGWDRYPREEQWVEGYFVKYHESGREVAAVVPEGGGLMPIEVEEGTVCRFTGQEDKDRVKIFEHDILSISHEGYKEDPEYIGFLTEEQGHFDNYRVEYLSGFHMTAFILRGEKESMHLGKELIYSRHVSVVGNEFDG